MRGQRQDKNLAAGLSGSGAANFRPLADTFIDDAGNIFRVTQEVPRSGGFGEPQIIPLFQSDPSKPFTAADIVGQPRPVSQSLRFEEGPRGTLGLNPGTGAAGGISATGGVQGGAQPGTTSNQAGPSNANAAPVVAPVATTGESKDVTQAATLPSFLDATEAMFRDLVTPGSESFASEGERIGVSIGRTLPGIGGKVEELIISRTSPDTVRVARNIDNVSDILLRLRSGAQINEQELKRLSKLLPKIGEGVESALNKFKDFRRELMTILRVKAQLQPGLFTDEILLDTIGMTQEQLFGGGSIVPQPTAEPSTGQPSVLERARALAERNRQEKQ